MKMLLGELEKVPAFPKKARALFNSRHSFQDLMKETDRKLESTLAIAIFYTLFMFTSRQIGLTKNALS
jgi:hypothetical protein